MINDEKLKELSSKIEEIDIENLKVTFLDVIRKNHYDENLVSDWLAFLFNPQINGIGNEPIKALLKSANKTIVDLDEQEFISIERETTTDKNKRMDLVIKYSKSWIIIENKINSLENGTQTKEYYEYINKQDKVIRQEVKAVYIYLKPNYNPSEPTEKNFKPEVTYSNFIENLNKIEKQDYKVRRRV